jgi:hypothetical protein
MLAEDLNMDEEVVSKDFTNKFEYGLALRQCTRQFWSTSFLAEKQIPTLKPVPYSCQILLHATFFLPLN